MPLRKPEPLHPTFCVEGLAPNSFRHMLGAQDNLKAQMKPVETQRLMQPPVNSAIDSGMAALQNLYGMIYDALIDLWDDISYHNKSGGVRCIPPLLSYYPTESAEH